MYVYVFLHNDLFDEVVLCDGKTWCGRIVRETEAIQLLVLNNVWTDFENARVLSVPDTRRSISYIHIIIKCRENVTDKYGN